MTVGLTSTAGSVFCETLVTVVAVKKVSLAVAASVPTAVLPIVILLDAAYLPPTDARDAACTLFSVCHDPFSPHR